jgi:hypothetical protein
MTLFSNSVTAFEREMAIKAGFIFNFARYSESRWFNEQQDDQYLICSTSQNFVDVAEKTLAGQTVRNQPVSVVYISEPTSGCHSLFMSKEMLELAYFQSKQFEHTMLVGENPGFIQQGGHLNFFVTGGKVRFEVSPENLTRSGLKLSSKVMRMGRLVKEGSK